MVKEFALFGPYKNKLIHGMTPLSMGSFQVKDPKLDENLRKFKSEYGIEVPVYANQVHGDTILVLNERPSGVPDCDGFMTNRPNLPIMVKVADCQGVLMYDPVTSSIAAIHSGWRGSTLNIIGKAVQKMRETYGTDPANLLVAISPSLGPCCAEFTDPKKELPAFCHPFIEANNHVNFWKLSMKQLQDEGVLKKHIELVEECTKSTPSYFSHRNGDSGRMGVFVTLK